MLKSVSDTSKMLTRVSKEGSALTGYQHHTPSLRAQETTLAWWGRDCESEGGEDACETVSSGCLPKTSTRLNQPKFLCTYRVRGSQSSAPARELLAVEGCWRREC